MEPSRRVLSTDLWVSMVTAAGLASLALVLEHGSFGGVPWTLPLALVGVALQPWGRRLSEMDWTDWLRLGPYLACVGVALAQDVLLERSLPSGSTTLTRCLIVIGSALLAGVIPQGRREGADLLGFILMNLLFGEALVHRGLVQPQEIACWGGFAVLRLALARSRRLELTAARPEYRMTWLILGRAIRTGLLLIVLAMLAELGRSQSQELRRVFEPMWEAGLERLRVGARAVYETVESAREWLAPDDVPGDPGAAPRSDELTRTLLSGQRPEPSRASGFPPGGRIGVIEPDQLRFERDVQSMLTPPGVAEDLVLARVRVSHPVQRAPYLRRTVFERYENGAWKAHASSWQPARSEPVRWVPDAVQIWISSDAASEGQLLVPSPYLGTQTELTLLADGAGGLKLAGPPRGAPAFSAWTWIGPWSGRDLERSAPSSGLLEVPEFLMQNPDFLAARQAVRERVARGESLPLAAAAHCRESFRYTQAPGHRPSEDPVLEFLRTRRGFCQHYATLCVFLLRAEGVPCRVAGGLAAGRSWHGEWLYGLDNGHAWVELQSRALGWLPLDPTAGTREDRPSPDVVNALEPPPASTPLAWPAPAQPPSRQSATLSDEPSGELALADPASGKSVPRSPFPGQGSGSSGAAASAPSSAPSGSARPGSGSSRLRDLLERGQWLLLLGGAGVSLLGLALLKRRAWIEEALAGRPGIPRNAAEELQRLRYALATGASSKERAQHLFELFSLQLAIWGYGRAAHETEREFMMAIAGAIGGRWPQAMEVSVRCIEEARYGVRGLGATDLAELEHALVWVLRTLGRRMRLRLEGPLQARTGWLTIVR